MELSWPEGTGVLIYDGNQTSAEDVIAYIKESKNREFSVAVDRPFQ
jgi:hypothetical protein